MSCNVNFDSELYQNLKSVTGDSFEALRLYSVGKSEKFMNQYTGSLDQNNDPDFEAVVLFDSGISSEVVDSPKLIMDAEVNFPNIAVVIRERSLGRSIIDEKGKYVENFTPNSNKSIIANKFFRYINKAGRITKPYFPYTTGNLKQDQNLVDTINGYFDNTVVFYNGKTAKIEFTEEVEQSKAFTQNDTYMAYQELELEEQRLKTEYTDSDLIAPKKTLQDQFISIINRKQELIKLLERRLTNKKVNRDQIHSRIHKLENEIKTIRKKRTNAVLEQMAKDQLIEINNNFTRIEADLANPDVKELTLLNRMQQLLENSYYLRTWSDINKLIEYSSNEDRARINQIQGTVEDLYHKYIKLGQEIFTKVANLKSFRSDFTTDQLFNATKDEKYLTSKVLGLHRSNIELLKVVDDLIAQARDAANDEFLNKQADIIEKIDQLKKYRNVTGNALWEPFLQYSNTGAWTGNLIGRYSYEFYQKKHELAQQALSTGKRKPYYTWLADNTREITLEEINSGKSDIFTESDIQKQRDLIKRFNEDKEIFRQSLIDNGTYDHLDETARENAIEAEVAYWDFLRNPEITFQENVNKSKISKDRYGFRDLYVISEKPLSKWKDNRFDTILSDPKLLEFYRYIKTTLSENNQHLPFIKNLTGNYIPELKKEFFEEMREANLVGKGNLIKDELIEAISSTSIEEANRTVSIKGKEISSIPVKMMEGKLTPDQKLKDLGRVLLEHTKMAINYKYKQEIEPLALAATDFIDEMEEIVSENKDKVFKKVISREGKLVNAKDHLQYNIDAFFYNKRKKREEGKTKIKLTTSEGKKQIDVLQERLLKGEITEEQFAKMKMEIGRNMTFGDIADTTITYTYLKALSFPNIVSPTVNLFYGILSNMIYAAGGVDIDTKSAIKAHGIVMKALTPKIGKILNKEYVEKIYAWMSRLDLLGDINESAYGKTVSFSNKLTALQQGAERINQGSLMVGILLTQKLKDKNGNTVSVWDAFKVKDGILEWDTERMGEQEKVPADKIKTDSGINMYRFGRYVARVNEQIHGDYKSPLAIKRTAAGRILALFKTWLGASVEHRFGEETYDQLLQRYIKGRYRSFFSATNINNEDLGFSQIMPKLLQAMVGYKKGLSTLSEVDKVNLLRNVRELQIVSALFGVMLLLKGLIGDDDDKYLTTLLLNTLSKSQADLLTFLNPNSTAQLMNNIVPIYGTVRDIVSIIPITIDTITGNGMYENGPWKDRSKLVKWGFKVVPGANGVLRLESLSERVFEYN